MARRLKNLSREGMPVLPVCSGSYGHTLDSRFQGDRDRCPVCLQSIRVNAEGGVPRHFTPRNYYQVRPTFR